MTHPLSNLCIQLYSDYIIAYIHKTPIQKLPVGHWFLYEKSLKTHISLVMYKIFIKGYIYTYSFNIYPTHTHTHTHTINILTKRNKKTRSRGEERLFLHFSLAILWYILNFIQCICITCSINYLILGSNVITAGGGGGCDI